MAITKYANNASSTLTLTAEINTNNLSINSADVNKFPSIVTNQSYFYATLINPKAYSVWEIVKVISKSSGSLYAVRGQQGTTARRWAVGTIVTQYVTQGDLENFLQEQEMVNKHVLPPIGTVLPWTSTIAPADYLLCNGASYDRVAYSYLFDVIGFTYGANNSTTFKVPDLRGIFVRGINTSSSGLDASRALGSIQEDSLQSHSHLLRQGFDSNNSSMSNFNGHTRIKPYVTSYDYTGYFGGTETRPYNYALPYIIRATF